jgi:hypothetical protein
MVPESGASAGRGECLAGPVGEQAFCGPITDGSDQADYEMARD